MRRRVVAILAVIAALVAAVGLLLRSPREPTTSSIAGQERSDEGPALLPHPADLAARRAAPGGDGSATDTETTEAPADDEAEEEEPPIGPSLQVVTVDAATGLPVPSTWNLGTGRVVGAPWPPDLVVTDAMLRAQADGVRQSVEAWEARFLPSRAAREDALSPEVGRPGAPLGWITIRPPDGHLPAEGSTLLMGPLAADVGATLAVVPVHREAPLLVRVEGPDGRPAIGAVIGAVEAAGRRLDVVAEDLGPGEIRLRGIPHLAGEPVAIAVEWGEAPESPSGPPPVPSEDLGPFAARSVIPEDLTRPWTLAVRLAGPTGPVVLDHNETDQDLPIEEDLLPEPDGPVGAARVVVLGWNGRPIPRAAVFGQPADRDGVLVLRDLPAGEHRFRYAPPGRLPAQAVAEVRGGSQIDVVLREPVGATLDVLVTDEAGTPRPSALLTVTGARVFDVVDGVQRLDRFTDARGRRTFARVEPGDVTVRASWGSRTGSGTVTLRDGERTSLRLVAK